MFTHGIRFEVAQDALGALLAHWFEAAAHALDAANPDPACLAEIEAEQRKLRSLRHDLDSCDAAQNRGCDCRARAAGEAALFPRVSCAAGIHCLPQIPIAADTGWGTATADNPNPCRPDFRTFSR